MNIQDITALYDLFCMSSDVVIDSRKVREKSLFFALKGAHMDGNEFALEAVAKGAVAAVVDNPSLENEARCFYVEDVLGALQQLSQFHRNTFSFPVIGLTGSNGKTTTKELIRDVLAKKYSVQATQGNLNNHIGVPLTILSVRTPLDFLIVEMGANHQGEIDFLSRIAQPDFGLITNIGKAHLEGFGGPEGVKKGKSELYRHLAQSRKIIFINGEDQVLDSLVPAGYANVVEYYPSKMMKVVKTHPTLSLILDQFQIDSHLFGQYNLYNIAAAVCIGLYFHVPAKEIAQAISEYIPDNNRSQIIKWGSNTVIRDAYNANPSSMQFSIENFAKSNFKNKILIIGDMYELGEYAEEEHRKILELVAKDQWHMCIFIGNYFYNCRNSYPYLFFETLEEAKMAFHEKNIDQSAILLKGSRGIALEKLLEP
jgi:UDP-N-acetylmuramoyl-tripeptide--D-alanyl-D-alanine ligase